MLTEIYIRNNINDVDFSTLEYGKDIYPIFSMSFYRDFSERLNWWKISKNNKLSYSFLKEFSNHIKWDEYFNNKYIIEFEVIKEFFILIPKRYLNYFVSNFNLSESQLSIALSYVDVDYFVDAFLISNVSTIFLNTYIDRIPKHSNKRDSFVYNENYNKFLKLYNIG